MAGPQPQIFMESAKSEEARRHVDGYVDMTLNLRRIVYLSTAAKSLSDDVVSSIAMQAGTRNRITAISGILLSDGRRFIQVLEGSPFHVEATMKRIVHDPRHVDIKVAENVATDRRCFGNWSMQFRRVGDGYYSKDFVREVAEAARDIQDVSVKALLVGFAALGR